MVKEQFVRSFTHAALSPDPDLAIAALMIARIEYPKLDAGPYLDELDAIGREVGIGHHDEALGTACANRRKRLSHRCVIARVELVDCYLQNPRRTVNFPKSLDALRLR